MNYDDFCFVRQGRQLSGLAKEERFLLEPVYQYGSGFDRALLLLHGFSSTPAVYRHLIPEIKGYDALVCPALPGHAKSLTAFSLSTARDWLNAAQSSCQALLNTYKKVDVLGLSLGGLLACELSAHFPLHRLFLLAPALQLQLPVQPTLLAAKFLKNIGFSTIKNAGGDLMDPQAAEITYRKLPLTAVIEMLSLVKNYQWKAPLCPVDLFLGEKDKVVASSRVAQGFSCLPNVTIHYLKNSAHVLPLDKDREEIVLCINKSF